MIYKTASLVLTGAPSADSSFVCGPSLASVANISASAEDADYPATNAANDSTALEWRAPSTAATSIEIDVGSPAQTFSYIALAKHNAGSSGFTVTFSGDSDGLGYDELLAAFTPTDDSPIVFVFQEATYQKIKVDFGSGGTVAPRCAVFAAGVVLPLEQDFYVGHTPISLSKQVKAVNGKSETGNFLGRITTSEMLSTSVELTDLTPSWYRTEFEPFLEHARNKAFFWGWKPESYPESGAYSWLTNNPKPVNSRANGMMSVALRMNGIA